MKIQEISYEQVGKLAQYETVRIGVSALINEGEDPKKAMAELRRVVAIEIANSQQAYNGQPIDPPAQKPSTKIMPQPHENPIPLGFNGAISGSEQERIEKAKAMKAHAVEVKPPVQQEKPKPITIPVKSKLEADDELF